MMTKSYHIRNTRLVFKNKVRLSPEMVSEVVKIADSVNNQVVSHKKGGFI